jgi:hypothetical protein
MAVKVYHAKKTLQLPDVLVGGGGQFLFWRRGQLLGPILSPKSCGQGIPSWNSKNTFFQVNGESIGSQSGNKFVQVLKVRFTV